jgi:ribosomal-protein-alanine N-acetyltransferase
MNKNAFINMPVFETNRLKIRPFEKYDFENYINWHDNGEIIFFAEGLYDFKNGDQKTFEKFFLQRVPRMYKSKITGIWCIADKINNENIGLIEVCKFDTYSDTAQIHFCLSKKERCKGYMTEAVNILLEWCFITVELNRVYTFVSDENIASSNVLKKCGFVLEGIMRQSNANKYTKNSEKIQNTKKDNIFISQKEYRNDCIYAILKNDYKR